jgi:uncharacterized protein (UPF0276 family)
MEQGEIHVVIPKTALGLGLRPPHYPYIFERWPPVDYFEIISENFLGDAPAPRRNLRRVAERYPVVLHGVGLNLLGPAPLDLGYLDRIRRLADEVDAAFVTDHLCWTGTPATSHHDLLPVPHVPELIELAAGRARLAQQIVGRPFGLENLSSYVSFQRSTMTEWDFYTSVVQRSGCWFLLDINNIQVSSLNHGFDPEDYLRAIDFSRVLQVHLAGHTRLPDGSAIDTHDHPICADVWTLYTKAWKMGGPFPTLIERDDRIPPMPELLDELELARGARA